MLPAKRRDSSRKTAASTVFLIDIAPIKRLHICPSQQGPIAQLVEPPAHNRSVARSSRAGSTIFFKLPYHGQSDTDKAVSSEKPMNKLLRYAPATARLRSPLFVLHDTLSINFLVSSDEKLCGHSALLMDRGGHGASGCGTGHFLPHRRQG